MLETAAALIFGHVLGDFTLQTVWMVREKRRPPALLAHVAIVTAVSWAALGFPPAWPLIAWIAVTHAAIDAAKAFWGRGGFRPFILDQTAHMAAIALGAAVVPGAYALGLWAAPTTAFVPDIARLPEALALGAGLIATVWAGDHAVSALMTGVAPPSALDSLPRGGRLIGKLERLLILMLVLAGQPDGIGLLIAAKSILRFNEVTGAADRHVSEYVIIGTLASFAWAIAIGYATVAALGALGS